VTSRAHELRQITPKQRQHINRIVKRLGRRDLVLTNVQLTLEEASVLIAALYPEYKALGPRRRADRPGESGPQRPQERS
jgi:hypothetical protein